MKCSNIFLKALLGLAFFASTASATTYNFSEGSVSLRFDRISGTDFTFSASDAGLTRTIVYNEITKTATATVSGTGIANGVATAFNYVMNFFNVIPITNPNGLLGFSGTGATSSGTLNISNLGDITGDGVADSASIGLTAKFMNFAGTTNPLYQEIAHLGNANFFLWDSISQDSTIAKAWYMTNNILINGSNSTSLFNVSHGDMHLKQEVPEPATALLLGMGAIGGAIRRRKSA